VIAGAKTAILKALRKRRRGMCGMSNAANIHPGGCPRQQSLSRIYRLLRWGQAYVDEGTDGYENRYRQTRITRVIATAKDLV
jgi:hypothetical protein